MTIVNWTNDVLMSRIIELVMPGFTDESINQCSWGNPMLLDRWTHRYLTFRGSEPHMFQKVVKLV